MKEERFTSINKCSSCKDFGYSTRNGITIFYCTNSINNNEPNIPKYSPTLKEHPKIGYPILLKIEVPLIQDILIPSWCKLPNPKIMLNCINDIPELINLL